MVRRATHAVASVLAGLVLVTVAGGGAFHQLTISGGRDSTSLEGLQQPQRLQGRHTTAYVGEPLPRLRTKRRKAHSHIRIQRFHARALPGSSGLQLPERDATFEEDVSFPEEDILAPGPTEGQAPQNPEGMPANSTGSLSSAQQSGSQEPPVDVTDPVLSLGPQDAWKDQYVALCLAVRDQHLDIREWISHHASIGVTKFYIMDNNSSAPLEPLVEDFLKSGLVVLEHMPVIVPPARPQIYIYDLCLRKYGKRHHFMGFLDADEFIILTDPSVGDLPSLLQYYENYGGLGLNWQMYSSSGLQTRPENGTLQSYTKCLPVQHRENLHIKTLANTRFTVGPQGDPHHFRYAPGKFAVNTRFEQVDGPRTKSVATETAIIAHYVLKSLEEYQGKIARGSAMRNQKTMAFWDFIEKESTNNCSYIQELIQQ